MKKIVLISLLLFPVMAAADPAAAPPAPDQPPVTTPTTLTSVQKKEFLAFKVENFVQDLRDKRPFAVITVFEGDPVWIEQEPVILLLMQDKNFRDLRVYKLNLMTQLADARLFDAAEPGLLMVYRDGQEISRTARVTSPEKVSALFSAAVNLPQ